MPVREAPIVVRFELRGEDAAAFGVHQGAEALIRRGRVNEVLRALGVGAAVAVVVAAAGLAGVHVGDTPVWAGVTVGVGLAIARWVTRPARMRRLLRARILERFGATTIHVTVTVDASGVTETRDEEVRVIPWTSVRTVEETGEHAYVRDETPAPVIVPRRAFDDDAGSLRDFVDTCRARAAGSPG